MACGSSTEELTEIINEDFLSCKICMEIYTDPKVLPCFHSYCTKCLRQIVAKVKADSTKPVTSFPCPECRYKVLIDDKGVDGLRNNFFILSLQEVFQSKSSKPKRCESCEEEAVAQSKCVECNHFLCADCEKAHKKMKLLKDHHVLSLDQLQQARPEEVISTAPIKCKDHHEALQLYCTQCEIAICVMCKAIDHDDHKCTDLKIAAGTNKEIILQNLKSMGDFAPKVKQAIDVINQEMSDLEKKQKELRAFLESGYRDIIDAVNAAYLRKKSSLDSLIAARQKKLALSKEALEFQWVSLQSTTTFNRRLVQHGQNAEIVATRKQLEKRLEELRKDFRKWGMKDKEVITLSRSFEDRASVIENMFGELEEKRVPLQSGLLTSLGLVPNFKSELLHSFQTQSTAINALATTNDGHILVADKSCQLKAYSQTGKAMFVIPVKREIISLAVLPNDTVIVEFIYNKGNGLVLLNIFKMVCMNIQKANKFP